MSVSVLKNHYGIVHCESEALVFNESPIVLIIGAHLYLSPTKYIRKFTCVVVSFYTSEGLSVLASGYSEVQTQVHDILIFFMFFALLLLACINHPNCSSGFLFFIKKR